MMYGSESDEVYLGTFIFNGNTNQSEFHIYNGKTMNSQPIVTFIIPKRVPYGFHGEWISQNVLNSHFQLN